MKERPRVLYFFLLLFGVFCGSTAVIMIKASTEHPFLVASYRLLVAALVLFPFFLRDLRSLEPGETYGWKQVGWSALPAVFLAFHFMTWVVGARLTQVANASLIANLTPTAMPFLVWAIFRERITRQEIVGTAFTLLGLVALSGSNLSISQDSVRGDLICYVSMLAFAAYLALGRKNGARLRLWLYMVPLYFFAGVICLICALFTINPLKAYTATNLLLMVGLGLIPTVLGHTIFNYSLKRFRGQVVSVTNLLQPVFASLLGFLIFREAPRPLAYVAAALIVTGVLIVLGAAQRTVTASFTIGYNPGTNSGKGSAR
ncbi:MAG TPA: DMT family transporter [Anaerolineaceae bacterium]|nr:DMT family transporter [Anaerolineaceae bacterium]